MTKAWSILPDDWKPILKDRGLRPFRADQILHALYRDVVAEGYANAAEAAAARAAACPIAMAENPPLDEIHAALPSKAKVEAAQAAVPGMNAPKEGGDR